MKTPPYAVNLIYAGCAFIVISIISEILLTLSYSYLLTIMLFVVGISLISLGIGIMTSGSSISEKQEDAGYIKIRTPEAIYHIAADVTPNTQPTKTSQPPSQIVSGGHQQKREPFN